MIPFWLVALLEIFGGFGSQLGQLECTRACQETQMLQRCGRRRGSGSGSRGVAGGRGRGLSIGIRRLGAAAAIEDLAEQLVHTSLEVQFLMEIHVFHLGA